MTTPPQRLCLLTNLGLFKRIWLSQALQLVRATAYSAATGVDTNIQDCRLKSKTPECRALQMKMPLAALWLKEMAAPTSGLTGMSVILCSAPTNTRMVPSVLEPRLCHCIPVTRARMMPSLHRPDWHRQLFTGKCSEWCGQSGRGTRKQIETGVDHYDMR